MPLLPTTSRRQTFIEIALIFAVFCIQGAWPVPGVNEPYYLGKAIHFWNPDFLPGDFFMESADTHKVFCITFGWLSLWLGPVALAWTGRATVWLLLAWAWRRLSFAVVPRPWYSVLTAALFACLMERCHMAGEWVIGGVEAKGFAYVFVLLAIESLARNRWNRAIILFGAASAFHVLVGGWGAVAAGLAWLWLRFSRSNDAWTRAPRLAGPTVQGSLLDKPAVAPTYMQGLSVPPLKSLWPGIVVGALLALPGVWPSLMLDRGVDRQTAQLAHQIYVFQRLPHHLLLTGIRGSFILRFGLLTVLWVALGPIRRRYATEPEHAASSDATPAPSDASVRLRRLRAFVGGAVLITLVGVMIQPLVYVDRALAADLLRYYWFRLSDVAVPLGVALEGVAIAASYRPGVQPSALASLPKGGATRWQWSRGLLALAIVIAAFHLGDRAMDRISAAPPRSNSMNDFDAWHAACKWVAESGEIPVGARFLTPRLAQTFGWYSHRSVVANWKDVPQDAKSMVEWWSRMQEIYGMGAPPPEPPWRDSLDGLGAARLKELGAKYDADYAITNLTESLLPLDVVYSNRAYVIYRLR